MSVEFEKQSYPELVSSEVLAPLPPFLGSFELDIEQSADLVARRLRAQVIKDNCPYFTVGQSLQSFDSYVPTPTSTMGYYVGSLDNPKDVFGEEATRGLVLAKDLIRRFGDYGIAIAISRLRTGAIAPLGSEQREQDLALYEYLDMTAKVEVMKLRAQMSADSEKIREETNSLVGNPLDRYSVVEQNGARVAVIKRPVDNRDFGIRRVSLSRIYSESTPGLQRGYMLRDSLFNGSIKGPHAISYIDQFLR